jgi:hypothetical protein
MESAEEYLQDRIWLIKDGLKQTDEDPFEDCYDGEVKLPKNWKEIIDRINQMAKNRPKRPDTFAPGQIWSTRVLEKYKIEPFLGTKLVMLTLVSGDDKDPVLRGVPISYDWEFAASEDMVIEPEDSDLNYQVMLQLWSEIPLIKDSLCDYLGMIKPKVFNAAQTVLSWINGLEITCQPKYVFLRPIPEVPDVTIKLVKWQFQDSVQQNGTYPIYEVNLGKRILSPSEPRAEYRHITLDEIEYLTIAID